MYVLIRRTKKGTQKIMPDRYEYLGDAIFAAKTRTRKSKNYTYEAAMIVEEVK